MYFKICAYLLPLSSLFASDSPSLRLCHSLPAFLLSLYPGPYAGSICHKKKLKPLPSQASIITSFLKHSDKICVCYTCLLTRYFALPNTSDPTRHDNPQQPTSSDCSSPASTSIPTQVSQPPPPENQRRRSLRIRKSLAHA